MERALQGGGWGHRGYPVSAVPAPNAAYITSSHCSQQSSQGGGQWNSKCGPAPPPVQFGAVPLTLLPLALWQPEPETHPRCLETSLGPQCPLGPTNPLFLCVLWENGEPPKQPMQIYANTKCERPAFKTSQDIECCFPPSCSVGFISICECVSDCVCM